MSLEDEIETITLEDVRATCKEFGRIFVHLPEHEMVIVMDDTILGTGFIKNFDDGPLGLVHARRWAIRMEECDEETAQSFEDVKNEYIKWMDEENKRKGRKEE